MGCSASCLRQSKMSLFGRHSTSNDDGLAILQRKLYIAKETPEPVFDLSECQLRQVPSGTFAICKVYRKELIHLNNNQLDALHHGGQLSDLYLIKMLNISKNMFLHLPSDIRYLVNLTELYIQHNYIRSLPDSIQCLQNLQILDAANNCLTKLTTSLGKLKKLQTLKITENAELHQLCPELGYAHKILSIELDADQYTFPPADITNQGTREIMKYLCSKINVEYNPISSDSVDMSLGEKSENFSHNPFMRQNSKTLWEEQEAAILEQENRFHEAAKLQREKFLSNVIKEQSELDTEIAKVQEAKDVDRLRLLKAIQEDEREIEFLVRNFIQSENLKPEVLQQQLQHELSEHIRLLQIIKQNYDNVKKADVLNAMEKLIEENYSTQSTKQTYQDHFVKMKQSILLQELQCTEKLEEFLTAKDQSHTNLVQQLLEDQDIQKAVVASLIERLDARSWSLNQEVALISSNLARLSVIEQEKKKMHVAYNFNELLHQRMLLINLLDDLHAQQSKRRAQLIETLREMETQNASTSDFWLKNYQKVVESAPKDLLSVGMNLDPLFANYLLQEGVIHCLPFLVRFLFSNDSLLDITHEKLKASGVSLTSDRESIMRSINLYVATKSENHNCLKEPGTDIQPSAPSEVTEQSITGIVSNGNVEGTALDSECVICMDANCEVAFVPCGHLCCCLACSDRDMDCCPMCRSDIERKMKIIIA